MTTCFSVCMLFLIIKLGEVVHTHNPSYSRGRDQENGVWKTGKK
jgi:hypothetical protein